MGNGKSADVAAEKAEQEAAAASDLAEFEASKPSVEQRLTDAVKSIRAAKLEFTTTTAALDAHRNEEKALLASQAKAKESLDANRKQLSKLIESLEEGDKL